MAIVYRQRAGLANQRFGLLSQSSSFRHIISRRFRRLVFVLPDNYSQYQYTNTRQCWFDRLLTMGPDDKGGQQSEAE